MEKERLLSLSLQQRRKEYRCKELVKLDDIKPWAEEGRDIAPGGSKIRAELFKNFKINKDINLAEKVSLYVGDITCLGMH